MNLVHVVGPLGVFGILSIILQAVGLFSPAWMIFSMESSDTKMRIDIRMGLWTMTTCVATEGSSVFADGPESGEICSSMSAVELESRLLAMSSSSMNKAAIGDWLALQALAVCAGISAICGITGLFVLARSSEEKTGCKGGTTLVLWLISAILILSAVGKQANDLHNLSARSEVINAMDGGFSLKFDAPWALIVSGIGGAFAAFVAVGMALFLVCRDRREAPGVWMEFGNKPNA